MARPLKTFPENAGVGRMRTWRHPWEGEGTRKKKNFYTLNVFEGKENRNRKDGTTLLLQE